MNIYEQYQQDALRTEAPLQQATNSLCEPSLLRLNHAVLGLVSDLHELKNATDSLNTLEEIGDALWFLNLGKFATGKCFDRRAVEEPQYVLGKRAMPKGSDAGEEIIDMAFDHTCELADCLKAKIHYGKAFFDPPRSENKGRKFTFDEIVTWHLDCITALLCYLCLFELRIAPQTIMASNIRKLQNRFPEAYSQERALARDKDAERAAINGEPTPGAPEPVIEGV